MHIISVGIVIEKETEPVEFDDMANRMRSNFSFAINLLINKYLKNG